MLNIFKPWYKKYFSNSEAIILFGVLIAIFGLFMLIGDILAPVFVSIVIAYLLEWCIALLVKHNIPRNIVYPIIYTLFLAIFIIGFLVLLPLFWRQLSNLFTDLPNMLHSAKASLISLAEKYPAYFSIKQIDTLISSLLVDIQQWAKLKVSSSLSYIPGIIVWLVYLLLVPLLVFFFLKDHKQLINWVAKFFPNNKGVLTTFWREMDQQIGNYIRGKIIEIIIIGFSAYLVFLYFDLDYAVLLSVLVGFSVVIPYVGVVLVTIPVFLVGYLQWGFNSELLYMSVAYLIIQILDGNVLVPILFSNAVNLHPVAIIVAILFFGSIWGVWGVFFAIPLATLIRTLLVIWPKSN